jgi:hypothetical protein
MIGLELLLNEAPTADRDTKSAYLLQTLPIRTLPYFTYQPLYSRLVVVAS